MARNKFDVDETLETPFNIKHLLRAGGAVQAKGVDAHAL